MELSSPDCGYKAHLLLGTQNPDQTFSDLNEDFAYFKLYLCPIDKAFHSMNANDREWNGNCPEHKSAKLQLLNEIPKICPKCGGQLVVVEEEALETEKEETTA